MVRSGFSLARTISLQMTIFQISLLWLFDFPYSQMAQESGKIVEKSWKITAVTGGGGYRWRWLQVAAVTGGGGCRWRWLQVAVVTGGGGGGGGGSEKWRRLQVAAVC